MVVVDKKVSTIITLYLPLLAPFLFAFVMEMCYI